ncbi:hypothetical protein OROMI_009432 [Orobanche minor]
MPHSEMQFSFFGDESEIHIPETLFDSESAGLMADSMCVTVTEIDPKSSSPNSAAVCSRHHRCRPPPAVLREIIPIVWKPGPLINEAAVQKVL